MVEPVPQFEERREVALAVQKAAPQIGVVVEMVGQQVRPSGWKRKKTAGRE